MLSPFLYIFYQKRDVFGSCKSAENTVFYRLLKADSGGFYKVAQTVEIDF